MIFDRFENRASHFTPHPSKSAAALACLALASLVAPGAYAQAPATAKSASIGDTKISSGTLKGKAKLTAATLVGAFTLKYTDPGGGTKSLELKNGDKIEGLEIESGAVITAGTASGGTLAWDTLALDPAGGTVTAKSLTGTSLKGAVLKDAKVVAGQQTLKLPSGEVTGEFDTATLQLADTSVGKVDIDNPVVHQSAVQAQPKQIATESPKFNTEGDYFKFNVNVKPFRASDADRKGDVMAPKNSCFRVSEEFEEQDPADSTKKRKMVRGKFETGWFANVLLPPYRCKSKDSLGFDPAWSYDVPKGLIMDERDRSRYGWTYGALVAPFKFYTKTREFSAGASVGPYLGYRVIDRPGSKSVVALSVGAATTNTTATDANGNTTNSNRTGVSYAFAYILDIKSDFNAGLIAGADYYSKSQNIPNSGKLWVGLSFGYKIN
jgi:hypothetical protein